MPYYYTRQSAFTAATKALQAIQTGVDGSTAGNFRVPQGISYVSKITAAVATDGGSSANTGIAFCIRLSGPGCLDGQQDLVLYAEHNANGAGAITSTSSKLALPVVIPVAIRAKPGNDISLSGAYYGTDTGNQFVGVTLEFS